MLENYAIKWKCRLKSQRIEGIADIYSNPPGSGSWWWVTVISVQISSNVHASPNNSSAGTETNRFWMFICSFVFLFSKVSLTIDLNSSFKTSLKWYDWQGEWEQRKRYKIKMELKFYKIFYTTFYLYYCLYYYILVCLNN